MPITVTCQCGAVYRVADQFAGKRTRCKKCNEIIEIPAPVIEPVAVEVVPEEPPAPQQESEPQYDEAAQAQWPEQQPQEPAWEQPQEGEQAWPGQPAPAEAIEYRSAPVGPVKGSSAKWIIAVGVGAAAVALGAAGLFFVRSSVSAPAVVAPTIVTPSAGGNVTTPGTTPDGAIEPSSTDSNLATYNQSLAQAIDNRKLVLDLLKQPKPDFPKIDSLDDSFQKLKRTMLNLSVEISDADAANIDPEQKKNLANLEFEVITLRAQVSRPATPESSTPPNTQPTTAPQAAPAVSNP